MFCVTVTLLPAGLAPAALITAVFTLGPVEAWRAQTGTILRFTVSSILAGASLRTVLPIEAFIAWPITTLTQPPRCTDAAAAVGQTSCSVEALAALRAILSVIALRTCLVAVVPSVPLGADAGAVVGQTLGVVEACTWVTAAQPVCVEGAGAGTLGPVPPHITLTLPRPRVTHKGVV